jgi:hypothetical protein
MLLKDDEEVEEEGVDNKGLDCSIFKEPNNQILFFP